VLRTIESTEAPDQVFLDELRERSAAAFTEAVNEREVELERKVAKPVVSPSSSRRLLRWGAPLSTAAAVLLAFVLWPGDQAVSLAWADVVAAVGKADSVHIKTESHDGGKTTRGEILIRDIGLMRMNMYELGDTKPPKGKIYNWVTGDQIEFDGSTRSYSRREIGGDLKYINSILVMMKMIGWPGDSDRVGIPDPDVELEKEGWRVEVKALDPAEHAGRMKKRFSFQVFALQSDGHEKAMFQTQTIWIDPDSNRVERIVFSYPPSEDDVVATFDFDPDFTNDVFEAPAGYVDTESP
jgi:hypothetical protein